MGFALSPTEANFNKPFIEKTLLMIRKRRITPLSGKIICLKARRGGNSSGAARGRWKGCGVGGVVVVVVEVALMAGRD